MIITVGVKCRIIFFHITTAHVADLQPLVGSFL